MTTKGDNMLQSINMKDLLNKFSYEDIKNNDDIVIVDIRGSDEYNQQHIDGALNIPSCDLVNLPKEKYQDKVAIFHCRSGQRTKLQAPQIEQAPFKEMYCLEGGIQAWANEGLPTQSKTKAPIDVMRQMQIIAGSLILLGVLLSFVNPWWLLLSAFVGAGLLTAGITGFCGMVVILKCLPWNKAK
jgi:rhodanese-related sulfurtransferase